MKTIIQQTLTVQTSDKAVMDLLAAKLSSETQLYLKTFKKKKKTGNLLSIKESLREAWEQKVQLRIMSNYRDKERKKVFSFKIIYDVIKI